MNRLELPTSIQESEKAIKNAWYLSLFIGGLTLLLGVILLFMPDLLGNAYDASMIMEGIVILLLSILVKRKNFIGGIVLVAVYALNVIITLIEGGSILVGLIFLWGLVLGVVGIYNLHQFQKKGEYTIEKKMNWWVWVLIGITFFLGVIGYMRNDYTTFDMSHIEQYEPVHQFATTYRTYAEEGDELWLEIMYNEDLSNEERFNVYANLTELHSKTVQELSAQLEEIETSQGEIYDDVYPQAKTALEALKTTEAKALEIQGELLNGSIADANLLEKIEMRDTNITLAEEARFEFQTSIEGLKS